MVTNGQLYRSTGGTYSLVTDARFMNAIFITLHTGEKLMTCEAILRGHGVLIANNYRSKK